MKDRALTYVEKRLKFDSHFTFHGGFWLMMGHLVAIVSTLITSYVFANYVAPETYGQYKYIISLGIFISAFSLTGTATAITQAAAKNVIGFYSYIKKINLHYSLFISLIAIIGAIYYYLNGNAALTVGLILIAVLQPLFNNSSLFYSYLQGKEQFRYGTSAHAIKALFTTIVIVTSALLTQNVTILLVCYFLSFIIINYALQWFFVKKSSETIEDTAQFRTLLSYTKHTSIQNIVSGISNQLDKILVFQNLGAVELAVYTFATALPDQYKGITKAVDTMLLPRFSKHSPESVKAKIIHKSLIYFLFLLFAVVVYILAAPYIFYFLFPQYMESLFLSQVYVISMLSGIGSIPIAGIKAQMSNSKLYRFNLLTSIFQILILLVLLPVLGLIGAILARVLYRFTLCGYAYWLYLKV
jgi:O-antigen/teichoic acid export membrane protein